jgi:predicted DNA-binding transcriptional regulator AlpA
MSHQAIARAYPARSEADAIPVSLKNFDSLPDSANVRLPVVTGLFDCSRSTVWRKVRDGTFPAPRKLSARSTAWRVGDLRRHMAELAAGSV